MYCHYVPHLCYHVADGFRELPGSSSGLTAKQIEALVDAGIDQYPTLKMLIENDGVMGRGLAFRRYMAVHLDDADGVLKIGSWKWRICPEVVKRIPSSHEYFMTNKPIRRKLAPSPGRLEATMFPSGKPRLVIHVKCRHCGDTHVHSWASGREDYFSHRAAHCKSPSPYEARCGYYIEPDPKQMRAHFAAEREYGLRLLRWTPIEGVQYEEEREASGRGVFCS